MAKTNKVVNVLSVAALASMVLSTNAFAKVDSYSVKVGTDVLEYNKAQLTESFLADKAGNADGAKLYKDFAAKLETAKGFYAFHDDKTNRYIDFNDVQNAFLADREKFNIENYVETEVAKVVADLPKVVKAVSVDKDGIKLTDKSVVTGELKVASVSAINVKNIKVVFTKAPVDTNKVTFVVQKGTTVAPLTTTWNAEKTEATLTSATNLSDGEYTVAVKDNTTDLGTTKITVAQPKVSKINITSSKLAVVTMPDNKQVALATYNVLDQFGNDITNSYLTNSIVFQTGIGSVVAKKGSLVITPSSPNLLQFTNTNVSITAYDSTTAVSANATLPISTKVGTLDSISLTALKNVDNKELTAGDTSSIFYIDYKAVDISGNETKDYNFVKNGLVLQGSNKDQLVCTSPYVEAKIVPDSKDSTKAVIQVQVVKPDAISQDLQFTISAMNYSGTSQLNLTLKKASAVDSFTLMSPTSDIAMGQEKEIPFLACDQNGKKITRYSDLKGKVTLTGGLYFEQNIDQTAKLMVKGNPFKGPQMVTAVTPTNKISTLTLNIQDAVRANSLGLDSSVLVNTMQRGSEQAVDFGAIYGGLSVTDQYGEKIDMLTLRDDKRYKIVPVSSDTSKVAITVPADKDGKETGKNYITNGGEAVTIKAGLAGTTTITFNLYEKNASGEYVLIDSKATSLSVIEDADIVDYTIDSLDDAIYTSADVNGEVNARDYDYSAKPSVYGVTSNGAKVVLNGTNAYVSNVVVDNLVDFKAVNDKDNGILVYARKFADYAKKESTAKLTVSIVGPDNRTHLVSTPVKSTSVAPEAKSIVASVNTTKLGITRNGDTIFVDLDKDSTFAVGNYITRVKNDDGTKVTKAAAYLYAKDQYSSKAVRLAQIVKEKTSTVTSNGFDIDANGKIVNFDKSLIKNGEYADISAATSTGLMKTIRIQFVNNVVVTVNKTALTDAIKVANTNKDAVKVSVDGKDVEPTAKWVTQEVKTTYENAIKAAQAVETKTDATQKEVDDAKTALETATKTFDAAKKDGIKVAPVVVNKDALKATIAAANTNKDAVKVSVDGKDVEPTAKWVTQEVKTTYENAIKAAQAVETKTDATQKEVDDAKIALETATKTFDAAKQAGTKVATVSFVQVNVEPGVVPGRTSITIKLTGTDTPEKFDVKIKGVVAIYKAEDKTFAAMVSMPFSSDIKITSADVEITAK